MGSSGDFSARKTMNVVYMAENMNADSTIIAAIDVYCEPWEGPRMLATRRLKKRRRRAMASEMIMLSDREVAK